MHDGKEGRGADWFLAHFNHAKEENVGIQYPPAPRKRPAGDTAWTQWGCLAACALCMVFVLGLCLIVGVAW